MMNETLFLSREKLAAFTTCRRQFQLRYRERLPWPVAPPDPGVDEAIRRGQQFHQLLERHFLKLDTDQASNSLAADPVLRQWWQTFQRQGPAVPDGRHLPEISLTVPAGDHLLSARFDLLTLSDGQAHIFDWKTGRPRPESELRTNWQTRLYLALLAESSSALKQEIDPQQLSMTYWYVSQPEAPITIGYSRNEHRRRWAEIKALVAEIERQTSTAEPWPLTDDLAHCARCAYQVICGRQAAGRATIDFPDDTAPSDDLPLQMEPDLP